MSQLRTTYNTFVKHMTQIYHLNSASAVLAWDQRVMMPQNAAAAEARGCQSAAIAGTMHDLWTSEKLTKLLTDLEFQEYEKSQELDEFEKANVSLTRREWTRRTKIPKDLVEEQSKLESEAYMVWVEARKNANFASFVPFLQRWVEIKQKVASFIDASKNSYDVILDEYERSLTTERIDSIFSEFKQHLVPFLKKILDSKVKIDTSMLESKDNLFVIEKQTALAKKLAESIGFSFENGRFDVSVHPFTISMAPSDVRITTRYRPDDFLQGIAGTLHESGHAMYEQGLNSKYFAQPVSAALGMGLHESQSLLWERHVGLSKSFWKYAWPLAQEQFEHIKQFNDIEKVYRAVNSVEPVFIRVESDELTYPLHVILRFEIEKDLFAGKIKVEDLPSIWNQKVKDYLGIVPPSDKEGVLQDVHWAAGAFGYFPTYLIGQMCAAQIYNAAKLQIPNLEKGFETGQFSELKKWLNTNVHSNGSLLAIDDLMKKVTGEPINPRYLIEFLESKYVDIYELKDSWKVKQE